MPVAQLWLVIEQIDLRRPTVHEEGNNAASLWYTMRQRQRGETLIGEHRRERGGTESHAGLLQPISACGGARHRRFSMGNKTELELRGLN